MRGRKSEPSLGRRPEADSLRTGKITGNFWNISGDCLYLSRLSLSILSLDGKEVLNME
jgi:hypothetical protein